MFKTEINTKQELSLNVFNPGPAESEYALRLQAVYIKISSEANWSESALFIIKFVNLYQHPGLSNLIGWK